MYFCMAFLMGLYKYVIRGILNISTLKKSKKKKNVLVQCPITKDRPWVIEPMLKAGGNLMLIYCDFLRKS